MARILEPKLDLDDFLSLVARTAKALSPVDLEARVYEVDFIENSLYLRTSTNIDLSKLDENERIFTILPHTITGDAIIENRVIMATKKEGYAESRFLNEDNVRAAFPIEFHDQEMPEGRTKYVLVVDKKGDGVLREDIVAALRDYSSLAGLAISIKELRDKLSLYYEENKNLALTGQHSAAIGHDIRSINIGVGGFLTRALRFFDDPTKDLEQAVELVRLARDNSAQIETLLSNFAQFNRKEISLNKDSDLIEALKERVDLLQNRADIGKNVKFNLVIPEKETGILVDRDWFGTVIENLVKNSVEACSGRAVIRMELFHNPESIIFAFEDNCGGIPPEMIKDVFTPFRTSKKKGQGLGLANVRKVVEEHGGVVSVANNPDSGCIFRIVFPRPSA